MNIKKTIALALSLALGACMLTACAKTPQDGGTGNGGTEGGGNGSATGVYTITFDANGGTFGSGTTTVMTAKTDSNGELSPSSVPMDPKYDGHVFDKWQDEAGNAFSFITVYTSDTTFKAQWTVESTPPPTPDPIPTPDPTPTPPASQTVTFNFTVSGVFDAPITDVHIHAWTAAGEPYTTWEEGTDVGGALMTSNDGYAFTYSIDLDTRGDIGGILVMFTQEGKGWYAKSTDCTRSFTAGTYTLKFGDWNNEIYGVIDWDTWNPIPFDLIVS